MAGFENGHIRSFVRSLLGILVVVVIIQVHHVLLDLDTH